MKHCIHSPKLTHDKNVLQWRWTETLQNLPHLNVGCLTYCKGILENMGTAYKTPSARLLGGRSQFQWDPHGIFHSWCLQEYPSFSYVVHRCMRKHSGQRFGHGADWFTRLLPASVVAAEGAKASIARARLGACSSNREGRRLQGGGYTVESLPKHPNDGWAWNVWTVLKNKYRDKMFWILDKL